MRSQIRVVQWPIKSYCRRVTTSARCEQSSEGPLDSAKLPVRACPIQGHRARSTHAALDSSVFETVTPSSIRSWEEVPGPKPLPLLGNTWRFAPYIGNYSVEHVDKVCLSLREQYGKCVKIAGLLGRPDMLFVFDAGEVERVFRSEDGAPHRPSMPSLNYYKHVLRKDFFGAEENCAGVIAVHGDSWSAFRTKVSRVALSTSAAAQYTVAVSEVADAFIDRLREIRKEDYETPDDFLNEVHKWSLESLGLIALDTRLGCFQASDGSESQRLIDAVNTFFLCVGQLELKAPWWRLWNTSMFKQYVNALDVILSVTLSHVERALEDGKASGNKSLLQDLVAAAGTRVAAVAALDMFLVGIDTTSNAVASTLYQLSHRPQVQERIYQEVSQVLQGRPLKAGDVNQMPYLKACIKEVLRMYPVVIGNGRQLTKDTVICGYNIPRGTPALHPRWSVRIPAGPCALRSAHRIQCDRGWLSCLQDCAPPTELGMLVKSSLGATSLRQTQVIFQHYAMGNSEEYFSEASQFRPERWLQRSPLQKHSAFASLPFGFGRRMCLGRRFAELEIHTVICKIVQAFKMEYHHEPLDYHVHPMYTPNGPIRIKMIDR